jgi:hypothetical protein
MTAIVQLDDYLRRLETRLRFMAASRGAAVTAGAALTLTVLLVWLGNQYRFAQDVVLPLRLVLFAALAAAIVFALAIPLRKLTRKHVTNFAEEKAPSFGERLLTVSERRDDQNPFIELIAEDAMQVAHQNTPQQFVHSNLLFGVLGAAVVAVGVLVWLITAGPGYWGYGASLLWTGSANASKKPLYDLTVQPGNKTIRRKSDQLVTAHLLGFSARQVTLHAKYGQATKWDAATMQSGADGNAYQFKFVGLGDPVEYYIQADGTQSKHFKISVRDLPGVKRVKVSLHYPAELKLKDVVFDPGGDIRAVEGTQADIAVLTDKPLENGVIVLEDGSRLNLTKGEGNWLTAKMPVRKDGSYHVAAIDGGEAIRISDDYFIESGKDEPPTIRIASPGKDPKVSPIEEVPITVEAADDFGIEGMDLHYSVNGGAEQVVPLLKNKGAKEATGNSLLTLENFKLAPGDLVAIYATARDATHTAHSDIIFAQAEPFDFKFSQSQQAGGGGGGGGQQTSDISERQKQIIAATWNQERDAAKNHASVQENAKFLSDTETKLADQAKTLAERMSSREMEGAGSSFANFSKLMTQASGQMGEAVNQLKSGKWHDAMPIEQKALQSLLRAESTFRDIEIAFGQRGGGGGGGGAQRDLARMFDLELDTSKNQYETGQQDQQQQQNDQQKAVDEALEKLKELARRQQELAAQRPQQQAFEQRWQEEQLRREAEELRRKMEEMAQNQQSQSGQQQGGQQQSDQQGGQQQSGQQQGGRQQSGRQQSGQQQASSGQSPSGQSSAGKSGEQQRQMLEAFHKSMDALRRSEEEMRKAVSDHDPAAQRRAAEDLAQAQSLLNQAFQKQSDNAVAGMSQKAQEMANAQREIANSLKNMYGDQPTATNRRTRFGQPAPGPNDMPEMKDPATPNYYGYGRRSWQPEAVPHMPNQEERAIASQKEKLTKDLQQLHTDMQEQERKLATTQPGASTKMRKALSDSEQQELGLRMQKTAEWMKQGYGDQNLGVESKMADGLDQLSRDLQEVQRAIKAGDPNDKNGQSSKNAEALAQVRNLRQMLERAQNERAQRQSFQQQTLSRNGGGQQQGSSQNGQQGGQQQGGQQQGGQQGGQQQGGQNAGGQYGPNGGYGPATDGQSIRGAISDLNGLRGRIDPNDRALRGNLDDALGSLRLLNADPNRLQSTIGEDAVSRLERLEVELARRAGELQQLQGARLRAPEDSPEKYRDAVAEYFKKLSQAKR